MLETSRLWREVVSELAMREFPEVELDHLLVDNAAMQLIAAPSRFGVIVTENMFGDILSDEAAMLTGSIGLLPSASLGDAVAGPGAFEPRRRLGPRHRGTGDRQSAGDVPVRGAHAPPRLRAGERGGRCRIGRSTAHSTRACAPAISGDAGTADATGAVLDHL